MLLPFLKPIKGSFLPWYSPHSLPDTGSLPRLFLAFHSCLIFSLSSLKTTATSKYLKFPLTYQTFSVPNFKAHLYKLCCLPRCSQLKLLFCVPSVLYSEFYHVYSPVSLPLLQLKTPWRKKSNLIYLCIHHLLHLPIIICWMTWLKKWMKENH